MRPPGTVLLSLIALASLAGAQSAPSPSSGILKQVEPRYSGKRAKETVAFLDRFVRWPGNRGFDASISHLVERLEKAGYVRQDVAQAVDRLTYRVEHYPMTTPAWEPRNAVVEIAGEREPVLRFATNRNMLATNSWSTPAIADARARLQAVVKSFLAPTVNSSRPG